MFIWHYGNPSNFLCKEINDWALFFFKDLYSSNRALVLLIVLSTINDYVMQRTIFFVVVILMYDVLRLIKLLVVRQKLYCNMLQFTGNCIARKGKPCLFVKI
jgi:hypothetical protein